MVAEVSIALHHMVSAYEAMPALSSDTLLKMRSFPRVISASLLVALKFKFVNRLNSKKPTWILKPSSGRTRPLFLSSGGESQKATPKSLSLVLT